MWYEVKADDAFFRSNPTDTFALHYYDSHVSLAYILGHHIQRDIYNPSSYKLDSILGLPILLWKWTRTAETVSPRQLQRIAERCGRAENVVLDAGVSSILWARDWDICTWWMFKFSSQSLRGWKGCSWLGNVSVPVFWYQSIICSREKADKWILTRVGFYSFFPFSHDGTMMVGRKELFKPNVRNSFILMLETSLVVTLMTSSLVRLISMHVLCHAPGWLALTLIIMSTTKRHPLTQFSI